MEIERREDRLWLLVGGRTDRMRSFAGCEVGERAELGQLPGFWLAWVMVPFNQKITGEEGQAWEESEFSWALGSLQCLRVCCMDRNMGPQVVSGIARKSGGMRRVPETDLGTPAYRVRGGRGERRERVTALPLQETRRAQGVFSGRSLIVGLMPYQGPSVHVLFCLGSGTFSDL